MKAITLLLSTLIISQSANAGRTCKDYITDEWPDSRYTIEIISTENVVTDTKTGLMWKQCSEGLSGVDCMIGTASTHAWKAALILPIDLNGNSGFAGYNDWRVPNIEELRSIAAINCYSPAISETAFPNTPNDIYWSSSPYASNGVGVWVIGFNYGTSDYDFRDSVSRVRLVRSGY